MASSSVCWVCHVPLAVDSAGGLCPTCLRSADTSAARPRLPVPASSAAGSDPTIGPLAAAGGATVTAPTAAAARLPDAPPGYDLLGRLGGGGMGDVYLARAHFADRLVAMKFLRHAGDPAHLDRFLQELRALAALDHPHIVRVLADDFLRADPYFTTEYAAGGSLAGWVQRHGPLAPADAARVVATVARAAAAAHAKGILHRDLKPSNILLAGEAGGEAGGPHDTPPPRDLATFTPKLADFGLAKRLDGEAVTVGTGPLGTPNFMPPEQISKKNGPVGPASDVYGLGATLYYLLTGRLPFGPGEPAEMMYRVLADPVPRPRAVRPDVPPELDGVVVKCLEKDPADRYPSADALADDLERFLAGETPTAPPMTRLRLARRWASRNGGRLAVAGAVAVVAAGLIGAGLAMVPRPARPGPPDPVEEMQAALAAGRPATLVGPAGPPRWAAPRLGAPGVGEFADDGGNVCLVESVELGLLELFPAPCVDRYRLTAEVRHLKSVPSIGPQADVGRDPWVGVYVGYAEAALPGGGTARTVYAVAFREVWPGSNMNPESAQAQFQEVAYRADRGKLPSPVRRSLTPPVMLGLAARRLGPWRAVEVDVTPAAVTARWRPAPAAEPRVLADFRLEPGPTGPRYVNLAAARPDRPLTPHDVYPGWVPRAPVGLLTAQAGIAVRNVVLTPLP